MITDEKAAAQRLDAICRQQRRAVGFHALPQSCLYFLALDPPEQLEVAGQVLDCMMAELLRGVEPRRNYNSDAVLLQLLEVSRVPSTASHAQVLINKRMPCGPWPLLLALYRR
jgi:hypothetical protein